MQIKRFEAKTMTAALRMVKDEFGINAVILSARSLSRTRSLFGTGRAAAVEVTAASDSGGPVFPEAGPIAAYGSAMRTSPAGVERGGRRGLFQSLNAGLKSLAQRPPRAEPGRSSTRPAAGLTRLGDHLLTQEVDPELVEDLIEQLQRLPGIGPMRGADELQPQALRILQDLGADRPAAPARGGAPRVQVLVGPAGAGKTSTAIKLAADRSRGAEKRKVALLTLDDQRIGAVEQVRIFSSILNLPLAVVPSAPMVQQAWEAFQAMDWLVVDTPGISLAEPERLNELRRMLAPLQTKEVHLVLNGCTREKELLRMVDAWRGFPVHGLALTRLDETVACGHLLNLLIRTGLPLSCLSTGPRIPEDLTVQGLAILLGRIWPGGENGMAPAATASGATAVERPLPDRPQLVANGNSELYHRSDCKWVRKIKPDHLIHFTSAAEAESRQFSACRNCHPNRESRPAVDVVGWGALKAAGGC
jgi:flagellar biosynthesis protein FlhF